ncbi:hypothetical protein MHYP_G00297130 [Metynnis hypsauchen]
MPGLKVDSLSYWWWESKQCSHSPLLSSTGHSGRTSSGLLVPQSCVQSYAYADWPYGHGVNIWRRRSAAESSAVFLIGTGRDGGCTPEAHVPNVPLSHLTPRQTVSADYPRPALLEPGQRNIIKAKTPSSTLTARHKHILARVQHLHRLAPTVLGMGPEKGRVSTPLQNKTFPRPKKDPFSNFCDQ